MHIKKEPIREELIKMDFKPSKTNVEIKKILKHGK